jgi:integrase
VLRSRPSVDRRRIDGLTTEDRSAHVVNDVWLRAAGTVVQWAVTRKRLPSNPFSGATVALPKRPPKLREREFNETEWRTILKATLEPPPARMEPYNAAARRWVPWICAYTGSRPGKATQLRGEDINDTLPLTGTSGPCASRPRLAT